MLAGIALVLCGVVLVVVQVRRGAVGLSPVRGVSAETRRAVARAIRVGETDDPEVDRLARRTLRSENAFRWSIYFYGTMLAVSVYLLIVGPHTPDRVLQQSALVLLWTGLTARDVVNRRRLNRYRGLRPTLTDAGASGV